MHLFLNQEIEKIVINESLIIGISWLNQFKDVKVAIDWSGQEDLKDEIDFNDVDTSLYFEFVTNFEFNCRFQNETMGAPEITSFSFKLNESIWSIEFKFKFYPIGYLKFNCNSFKFIISSKNSVV